MICDRKYGFQDNKSVIRAFITAIAEICSVFDTKKKSSGVLLITESTQTSNSNT